MTETVQQEFTFTEAEAKEVRLEEVTDMLWRHLKVHDTYDKALKGYSEAVAEREGMSLDEAEHAITIGFLKNHGMTIGKMNELEHADITWDRIRDNKSVSGHKDHALKLMPMAVKDAQDTERFYNSYAAMCMAKLETGPDNGRDR